MTGDAIRRAVIDILRCHRMVAEGSAAAAVVAVTEGALPAAGAMAVVLTGSNIDFELLKSLLHLERLADSDRV